MIAKNGCRFFLVLLIGGSAIVGVLPGARARDSLQWQTFELRQFGTTIDLPAAIFVRSRASAKGGERFDSEDGRAVLSIYARANNGDTPASYLRKELRVRLTGQDYERVTRSFFAVSTEREGLIYYSRCNFTSPPAEIIHCFQLVYPQAEKRDWDPVVTRMSLSLRPRGG
jgi:hypothetical protein